MLTALTLLFVQGLFGTFDTLYYHEYKLRLPAQHHAQNELRLHALRDFVYAILFCAIGWVTWDGIWAWVFLALLLAEIILTLSDFLEEDRTRKLPPGERVMHALMGIIYGLFLAYLLPNVWGWTHAATGFRHVTFGWLSWVLSAMAVAVFLSGVRDMVSAQKQQEWPQLPHR